MILEMHIPEGRLAEYLDNIVFYEDFVPPTAVEKLLPNGCTYLLLDMEDKYKKLYFSEDLTKFKELSRCYVSGQHKNFIYIESAMNASMMVVQLKPGGACPFFDLPVSALNNNVEQLERFWGDAILDVRKRIIAEKDVQLKFKLFCDFLLKAERPENACSPALAAAIRWMVEEPFNASTKKLAERVGVSQKHLISLFAKHVGLTPKYLARIYRFQKVLLLIEEKKETDWMQIVHDCGYYDQAHFVKDFYNFSGINPTVYLQQKGEYLNFIPVKP